MLQAGDAGAAATLSAAFGWPHREADWAVFLRIGHGVAWREGGALGGTAMWFPFGDAHASIGLVQVAPGLQGRGIGRALMRSVMAAAGDRSLMLHATAEGAGLYASLGFVAAGVVRQFQGVVSRAPEGRRHEAAPSVIRALDETALGFARGAVLDAWMEGATVSVAGPPERPTGYALRRRFGRGMLIGPVVADGDAAAMALVASLTEPGFLRIDVLAEAAVLGAGLACVGEVQAMTRGAWPKPRKAMRRMALASQALG